jgi:hypothetical protein
MPQVTVPVAISQREKFALASHFLGIPGPKGAIAERAFGRVLEEFGLLEVLPTLDQVRFFSTDTEPKVVEVSPDSVTFVLEAMNADVPKSPLNALTLRPFADRLAKAGRN